MSVAHADPLASLVRDAGEDWLLDEYAPPEGALGHVRRLLGEISAEAVARGLDPFDETILVAEWEQNPHHVQAFLQTLGGHRSPQMLLMAWRAIRGAEIRDVRLDFRRSRSCDFVVVLRDAEADGRDEIYESDNIEDAALLRHFGIARIDGRPVFDGFWPLRIR
jgi:hypothetical protein